MKRYVAILIVIIGLGWITNLSEAQDSCIVGRTSLDQRLPEPTALWGEHSSGISEIGNFTGDEDYLLHSEDVLILVADVDDESDPFSFAFNNISGRPNHGQPEDVIISVSQVLEWVQESTGYEFEPSDVTNAILIPQINCNDAENWDWEEAIDIVADAPGTTFNATWTGNWSRKQGGLIMTTGPQGFVGEAFEITLNDPEVEADEESIVVEEDDATNDEAVGFELQDGRICVIHGETLYCERNEKPIEDSDSTSFRQFALNWAAGQ